MKDIFGKISATQLTLFLATLYVASYVFEASYLSYFGIDINLVQINTSSLIASMVSLVFTLMTFIGSILIYQNIEKEKLTKIDGTFIALNLIGLAIAALFKNGVPLIMVAFFSSCYLLFKNSDHVKKIILSFKIGRHLILTLLFIILTPALSGYFFADLKFSYFKFSIINSSPSMALVRGYGDTLLFLNLCESKDDFSYKSGDFSVHSIGTVSENNYKFRKMKLRRGLTCNE